jgi:CRISPR system Cascade subunit CasA
MTRPSFDVSKEPCVPVLRNGTLEHVSLRDALVNAHEYLEIQHELLTVEFGLYRLLIALMGDIFFVEPGIDLNTVYLGELIQKGCFDAARVDGYFAKYASEQDNRFDLFSETRPFLQVAGMNGKETPIAGLLHPLPSGTNVSHFHHGSENDFAVSPASAVGLLSTIAPFMTAGGAGLSPSINGAPPIYVLIRGFNLFETICLNLCALPFDVPPLEDDAPSWRSQKPIGGEKIGSGYLESLTWMPRKLQFTPGPAGRCHISGLDSAVLIHTMKFVAGNSTRFEWRDPNCAYRLDDEKAKIIRMRPGRTLWRDSAALSLLENKDRIAERPRVVSQFASLVRDGIIEKTSSLKLKIFGLRTSDAKYCDWLRDNLELPVPLVLQTSFGEEIQTWLDKSQAVSTCFVRAISYLHPKRYRQENESSNRAKAKRKFKPWNESRDRDDVFTSVLTYSERRYWETLKSIFDDLISQLARLETNNVDTRQPLRDDWRKAVEREARNAFERAAEGLRVNNHALERVVRARRGLEVSLKTVFEPKPVEEKSKSTSRKSKKGDQ